MLALLKRDLASDELMAKILPLFQGGEIPRTHQNVCAGPFERFLTQPTESVQAEDDPVPMRLPPFN
jgi:hypothetical protein